MSDANRSQCFRDSVDILRLAIRYRNNNDSGILTACVARLFIQGVHIKDICRDEMLSNHLKM